MGQLQKPSLPYVQAGWHPKSYDLFAVLAGWHLKWLFLLLTGLDGIRNARFFCLETSWREK